MAKEMIFKLNHPNYTVYHRAALGGLAATVKAWGNNPPEGIKTELHRDYVKLSWTDEISDQEAIRRMLDASFKLTPDKMIDLPGHGIKKGHEDLRLAIHNGITGTFLQHNKMRPGEKEPRRFELKTADDEVGDILTYKAVNSFAHQKAQGTGLFNEKLKGKLPTTATIPQSVVPGAMNGALELQSSPEEAFLLLYLMIGCAIFLLRPRSYQDKAQYCVVVPDVLDLIAFANAIRNIAAQGHSIKRFSNTYLDRVVGGAEEAALRFLIDLQAEEITSEKCVRGCLAIAMGKVAWDANQINRSIIAKLKDNYDELGVFRAAYTYLGGSKPIKSKKGESFIIPVSPVPELVAANLASERHWCSYFKDLVKEKKDFERMLYSQRGLNMMKEKIKDIDDQTIIRAFHEAWRLTMRSLYERATRDGLDPNRLLEVERERTRNAILRAKTSEALSGWFLRFCADATKGGSLNSLRDEALRTREFIFNPRNFERFQNLCLFALVSYASENTKTATGGE
jgi:CRISPR-associated protein Cas8a1/Csx13